MPKCGERGGQCTFKCATFFAVEGKSMSAVRCRVATLVGELDVDLYSMNIEYFWKNFRGAATKK